MIHSNEFRRCFFGWYPDVGAYRIRPLDGPARGRMIQRRNTF